MNNKRANQTIKFLKWSRKYPGWWLLICGHERDHMNLDMMQMLIKKLASESLYEMIFVLLEVHKNEEFMRGVNEFLLKDLLISEWKRGNKDEMIRRLIAYFE